MRPDNGASEYGITDPSMGQEIGQGSRHYENNLNIPGRGEYHDPMAGSEKFMRADPGSEDEEERNQYEAAYANESMNEERDRANPESGRLLNAETVEDVAAGLPKFERNKDWNYSEANDEYMSRRDLEGAVNRARALGKPISFLTDKRELIVVKDDENYDPENYKPGIIESSGKMAKGSRARVNGYAISVRKIAKQVPIIQTIEEYVRDEAGARTGEIKVTKIDTGKKGTELEEVVFFGTDKKREILSKAYTEFAKQVITGEKNHLHTSVMWANRAALETLLKTFYFKELFSSNDQIEWFFSTPDIRELKTSPENTDVGDMRDKGFRLFELLGQCETKEKIEAVLNKTFLLESILDQETQNRVLGLMKQFGKITNKEYENLSQIKFDNIKVDERYKKVVEFLIGMNIKITNTGPNNVFKYELGDRWKTQEQRDPSKASSDDDRKKRGAGAIAQEQDVRGWLFEFGNPYVSRDTNYRDVISVLQARVGTIVGNSDAALEAWRKFYIWGEPDWLGLEVYAPDAIPTGEALQQAKNEKIGKEWLEYAKLIKSYFVTGGESVGTDLIKLFQTEYYRMKDLLSNQGRPSGPYATVDKFKHLSQALMGLARSKVKVRENDKHEAIMRTRNVRERMCGVKSEKLGNEQPIHLKDMGWNKLGAPEDVLSALTNEDPGKLDWKNVKMPKKLKEAVDRFTTGGDKKEVEGVLNDYLNLNNQGIGAGIEGFYWLMNFLTGDENPVSRWWQVLTHWTDFKSLTDPDSWTKKIKFADITRNATGSFDGYVSIEERLVSEGLMSKDNKDGEALDKEVSRISGEEANSYMPYWFQGVQSEPGYRNAVAGSTGAYELDGVTREDKKMGSVLLGDGVTPGLAQIYGAADMSNNYKDNKSKHKAKRFKIGF